MQAHSYESLVIARDHADAFNLQNPGLRAELERVNAELARRNRRDNFYASLAESMNRYGSLTERQAAALKRSLTQYHDRAAQYKATPVTSPIPTGRVQITGTVKSVKWQDNDFGGAYKMLVQSDAGWRVWGTVPAALGQVEVGNRITFVAAVTPKDAEFGFFSRPSQARRLDSAAVTEVERAPEPAPVVKVVTPLTPAAPKTTYDLLSPADAARAPKLAEIIARLHAQSPR